MPTSRPRRLMRIAVAGFLATIAIAAIDITLFAQKEMPSWTATNRKQLNALFADAKSVDRFLQGLSEDGFAVDPNTKEWVLVDLAGDGHVELLATIDPGGRDFVNALVCVWQDGSILKWQSIEGFELEDLRSRIVKLLPTGQRQVIVDDLLEEYQGAKAVPSVTHVYTWSGTGLVLSDTKYKRYYRTVVLPKLEDELKRVSAPPDERNPDLMAMYQKEIAAVHAILNEK